jgi:hypothetical protein
LVLDGRCYRTNHRYAARTGDASRKKVGVEDMVHVMKDVGLVLLHQRLEPPAIGGREGKAHEFQIIENGELWNTDDR